MHPRFIPRSYTVSVWLLQRGRPPGYAVDHRELGERLNRLVSKSSIGSSLPSLRHVLSLVRMESRFPRTVRSTAMFQFASLLVIAQYDAVGEGGWRLVPESASTEEWIAAWVLLFASELCLRFIANLPMSRVFALQRKVEKTDSVISSCTRSCEAGSLSWRSCWGRGSTNCAQYVCEKGWVHSMLILVHCWANSILLRVLFLKKFAKTSACCEESKVKSAKKA